jgi:uncharacterized DUF497 family protein
MALTFEWDIRKAAQNRAKHRVSFEEALTVFADPLAQLRNDESHSIREERLILLGRSISGRLLAVMFTDHGAERIRLFSARRATRHERSQYEEDAG